MKGIESKSLPRGSAGLSRSNRLGRELGGTVRAVGSSVLYLLDLLPSRGSPVDAGRAPWPMVEAVPSIVVCVSVVEC